MKKYLFICVMSFVGVAARATPVKSCLERSKGIVTGLNRAEQVLAKEIRALDKAAKDRGGNSKLNRDERGRLVTVIGELNIAASSVETGLLYIRSEFERVSRYSPEAGHIASVEVVSGDLEAEEASQVLPTASIERMLGILRTAYFSVHETSGSLIVALTNAVRLSSPSKAQFDQVKAYYQKYFAIFERSYKRLQKTNDKSLGDRTITYMYGSTFGSLSDVGPSDLSGPDALKQEKRLSRELAVTIKENTKGKFVIETQAGLTSDCESDLSGDE